jgi:hypothetical protein
MARMMKERAERIARGEIPKPPENPPIRYSKEICDRVLAKWRIPGFTRAELRERYAREHAAFLENLGSVSLCENEPLPSGPESSEISSCVEEPESEPESDEETRALRVCFIY